MAAIGNKMGKTFAGIEFRIKNIGLKLGVRKPYVTIELKDCLYRQRNYALVRYCVT